MGAGASRCKGERNVLGRERKEARWHSDNASSGGAHTGEDDEGKKGLTERLNALGGAFRDGEVEAERIEGWPVRQRRTVAGKLGSSNGDGGAGAVRVRARRRERRREQAHRRGRRMAIALMAVVGEVEVVALAGARMPATRRRGPDAVGQTRSATAAPSGRREKRRARWGLAGFTGWAGWLAPARQ